MTRKVSDKSAQPLPIVVKNEPTLAGSGPAGPAASPMADDYPTAASADSAREFCVVFLGTAHKQKLFNKLLTASQRFERHIQYKDTYYLYFTVADEQYAIELTDPGLAHTGAREMAIRKADAVILSYAAHDAESFHRLASLAKDFECRRHDSAFPPVLLICNEDENDENTARSSGSEGYESAGELGSPSSPLAPSPTSPGRHRRRRDSMERIELSNENSAPITAEQGHYMANLFGPYCEFLSISVERFDETSRLVEDLLRKIQQRRSPSVRKSQASRKSSRPDFRAAISSRLRRRRASAATSVEEPTPELGSSDGVESPSGSAGFLSLNRINPFVGGNFAPLQHISPMFRRRKSKAPMASQDGESESATDRASAVPEASTPSEADSEGSAPATANITKHGGVTKIQIYDDEPRVYRSKSAHALNVVDVEPAARRKFVSAVVSTGAQRHIFRTPSPNGAAAGVHVVRPLVVGGAPPPSPSCSQPTSSGAGGGQQRRQLARTYQKNSAPTALPAIVVSDASSARPPMASLPQPQAQSHTRMPPISQQRSASTKHTSTVCTIS